MAGQIEKTRRIPAKVAKKRSRGDQRDGSEDEDEEDHDDDDDDDDDDDEDDDDEFPTSHGLCFKTQDRAVTSLCVDPSGGRFLTGSIDGSIKLHDFASMTPSTLRAFKSVDPWREKQSSNAESHAIHAMEFAQNSGNIFLCITAHPQAKLMTRDGDVLLEFVKGDMYLRDMNQTKGHVSEITTGTWHPSNKDVCLTAGTDSTLRIWDVNNRRSHRDVIVFKSKAAGSAGRSRLTAAVWTLGAAGSSAQGVIMATALDGTLAMWGGDGPFTRTASEVRNAHEPGTWTSGLDVSADGRNAVTRGGDGTIKLWDTRKLTQAVVSIAHESSSDRFQTANIKYAPGSAAILTGSATGHLHILNSGNLRTEHVTEVTPGSPLITVGWHPKLNQILTGSANGATNVLFSPTKSHRGVLDILSRAPKKRHIDDDPSLTMDQASLGFSPDAIITPGAQANSSHRRNRDAGSMFATNKGAQPAMPTRTPFRRTQPDEGVIAKNIPLAKMLHEDPREALLKYADVAKKDPVYTNAWKASQPTTEYADVSDGEEVKDIGPDPKRIKRR